MEPQKEAAGAPVHSIVLLPCPFCGGSAVSGYDEPSEQHFVECKECGAALESATSEQRCITGWNNRRSTGLVNWLVSEMEKIGEASYLDKRYQGLRDCRKMVKRLLGQ